MHQRISAIFERALLGPDNEVNANVADLASSDSPARSSPPTSPEKGPATDSRELWQHLTHGRRSTDRWQATAIQPRALVGLVALVVAVVCVFASYATLKISDGKAVADWVIQPTVYLAAITAIANSAIALARMEAVPVCWWYSATHGRTVRSLERQWQVSRSVIQAVRYGRQISLLSFACILAALVVIDGPFVQRASTIRRATHASTSTIQLSLPPELPTGFGGAYDGRAVLSSEAMLKAGNEYWNKAPISADSLNVQGCDGSCKATVLAPAFEKTDCTTTTWPITRDMLFGNSSSNATWGPTSQQGPHQMPAFFIEIRPISKMLDTGEALRVKVGRLLLSDSNGAFRRDTCILRPGIGRFQITFEGNSVQIPETPIGYSFVTMANNTLVPAHGSIFHRKPGEPITLWRRTTVDPLAIPIFLQYSVDEKLFYEEEEEGWKVETSTQNAVSSQYGHPARYIGDQNYADPLPDILWSLNQLMFRCAVKAATWTNVTNLIDRGLSVQQSVPARVIQLVFRSDLRWFAGAAVLELGAVLLILPMFWGFWTLGCDTSLSPLNAALAFDSPLLKNVNSHGGAKGVVRELGNVKLKFGHVINEESSAEVVTSAEDDSRVNGRLGFADAQSVLRPRNGIKCLN